MTRQEIKGILSEVSYANFRWLVGGEDTNDGRLWIRASFIAPDIRGGRDAAQFTRRWYVSKHATKSEVVQTALKCVLTAVEHEARENFRYKGKAIFGPHFDVDQLVKLCSSRSALDVRHEPEEVAEAG